jgi:hypothetical protein
VARQVWASRPGAEAARPNAASDATAIKEYMRQKYISKKWHDPNASTKRIFEVQISETNTFLPSFPAPANAQRSRFNETPSTVTIPFQFMQLILILGSCKAIFWH